MWDVKRPFTTQKTWPSISAEPRFISSVKTSTIQGPTRLTMPWDKFYLPNAWAKRKLLQKQVLVSMVWQLQQLQPSLTWNVPSTWVRKMLNAKPSMFSVWNFWEPRSRLWQMVRACSRMRSMQPFVHGWLISMIPTIYLVLPWGLILSQKSFETSKVSSVEKLSNSTVIWQVKTFQMP